MSKSRSVIELWTHLWPYFGWFSQRVASKSQCYELFLRILFVTNTRKENLLMPGEHQYFTIKHSHYLCVFLICLIKTRRSFLLVQTRHKSGHEKCCFLYFSNWNIVFNSKTGLLPEVTIHFDFTPGDNKIFAIKKWGIDWFINIVCGISCWYFFQSEKVYRKSFIWEGKKAEVKHLN